MTDIVKIYIHLPEGNWVDVSTKQMIIYGAGQGCLDLMSERFLPNVAYIIDSDKNKWGKRIELLNVIYKIQPPSILASLKSEKFFIIISSDVNEVSIKKNIQRYLFSKSLPICNRQTLFFSYNKIEDLLYYDPFIKKKLLLTNMSFAVEKIITIFKNALTIFKNTTIDRFMPLREGESKFAFIFGNESALWVFSIPGYHNGWENVGIERDREKNRKIRYELRKRIDIDRAITEYEDEYGVMIQKYADDYIDFTKDDTKRIILDKCRLLHQTNEVIDIQNDMIEFHYKNLTEKVLKRAKNSTDIIIKIKSKMDLVVQMLENIKYTPQICHCDLLCTNVVCYKGNLFFIDWEYMAMSDAMFDVCRLLFSMGLKRQDDGSTYENAVQNIYKMLRRDIEVYFDRKCTDEEYLHAFLVMLIFECREFYEDVLIKRFVNIEKAELLINRINCLMKNYTCTIS